MHMAKKLLLEKGADSYVRGSTTRLVPKDGLGKKWFGNSNSRDLKFLCLPYIDSFFLPFMLSSFKKFHCSSSCGKQTYTQTHYDLAPWISSQSCDFSFQSEEGFLGNHEYFAYFQQPGEFWSWECRALKYILHRIWLIFLKVLFTFLFSFSLSDQSTLFLNQQFTQKNPTYYNPIPVSKEQSLPHSLCYKKPS